MSEEKRVKLEIFYLLITRAYPDYKRSYCSTSIYHFGSREEAEAVAQSERLEYYRNCGVFERFRESVREEDSGDKDENEEIEVTSADLEVMDEMAHDIVYADIYMDMSPFSAEIGLVKIQSSDKN
jgi:hypothetical protein